MGRDGAGVGRDGTLTAEVGRVPCTEVVEELRE
jgi:hypothetical protein